MHTLIWPLGAWKIAGSTCHATLAVDRPRSITISLEWSCTPGPTENEHLDFALPDIVRSACAVVEEMASVSEDVQRLIAQGKVCRIATSDGWFLYALTDPNIDDDTFLNDQSLGPV